jgi:cysteine-rich repeat protein
LGLVAMPASHAWSYDRACHLPAGPGGRAGTRCKSKFDDDRWQDPVDLGPLSAESDGKIRIVVRGPAGRPTVRCRRALARRGRHETSERSNECEIHYADVAPLVDSDGDGLKDAEEVPDLDQRVDRARNRSARGRHRQGTVSATATSLPQVPIPRSPTFHPAPRAATASSGRTSNATTATNRTSTRASNNCVAARCGDRIVEQDVEECDDGNDLNGDACLNDCRRAVCGDGYTYRGVEQCDDGAENSDIADGACRTNCTLAECSVGDPEGRCADENRCTTDICSGGNCDHEYNTAPCDDGIPCTTEDACAAGTCVGHDNCPDGAVCNFAIGECEHQAARTPDCGCPRRCTRPPSSAAT